MFDTITGAYTKSDHFDAYALFQFLIVRELGRHGRSSHEITKYRKLGSFHELELSSDEFRTEMQLLSLATIFDVSKHGRGCSDSIFHD
jgi:hypothetical protein